MGRIEAILLAAGYSSRMGRLKSLLPIGGTTVIRRQAEVLDGLTDRTIVVTGTVEMGGSTFIRKPRDNGQKSGLCGGYVYLGKGRDSGSGPGGFGIFDSAGRLPAGNTVADRRSDRGIPPLGRSRPVSLFFNAERPSSCDLGRLHSGYTVLSGRCGTKRSTDTI